MQLTDERKEERDATGLQVTTCLETLKIHVFLSVTYKSHSHPNASLSIYLKNLYTGSIRF